MSVRITVVRGPKTGQSFEFDKDEISIGSGRNNDLIIQDNDVSTNHCRLLRVERDYDIEDMGSRYGTFVNGQRIAQKAFTLPDRSIIELGGQVTLEYALSVQPSDAEDVPRLYMLEGDPGSQPVLVQMGDDGIQNAFLLQQESLSIGRSTDNDIIIQEIDISRKHVQLTWKNRRFYARDLDSRNGTHINGTQLKKDEIALHHSDVMQLGATVRLHLIFRSDLPDDVSRLTGLPNAPVDGKDKQPTTMYAMPATKRKQEIREAPTALSEGELKDHIFLVYARNDWEVIVATIYTNLNDAKQNVWVDQALRPDSDVWRASIAQAQRECWLLVVVMSPEAVRSAHVKDQYRHFYNREKPIIVVEYKSPGTMPIQLAQVPRIKYDAEQPGKMFQRLLYEIMRLKPRYLNE